MPVRRRGRRARDGINYRTTPEWSKRVMELTAGRGADVIVDVGGLTGYDGQIPAVNLLTRGARAQGIYVGSRADYLRMSEFIVKHGLKPVIEREFPLERYEEALKLLESGDFVGKIVLRL
jgi:NADPH:quinone reductase-like Zn-dependent oxidoreductase